MKGKNIDIEVLRGVAIIITIYAHLRILFPWSPPWFENSLSYFATSVGVDLFFCISGYVITRSIYNRDIKSQIFIAFSLPFWIRRMWRLWPTAFAWIIIGLISAKYINWNNSFYPFENTVYSSIAAVLQVANVYYPYCIEKNICGSNLVYWSLSLEEQFYFIFPFLIYFLKKRTLTSILLLAISLQFFIFRHGVSIEWVMRTDAICAGVLLALFEQRLMIKNIPDFMHKKYFGWITFITSFACIWMIPATHFGAMAGVVCALCFILVYIAANDKITLIPNGFIKRFFIYLGGRSYAIYVCHEVIFRWIREFYSKTTGNIQPDSTQTLLFASSAIILIFIFAEANYRLLEVPFRNKGREIAEKIKNKYSSPLIGSPHCPTN
ncbi:acyltransferase family protein [Aeromonas veronii]|uniref:acyltransferase family protein n=1 Tax=Aeromonas veronii TaxID=654 RepID=UPI003BA11A8C